MLEPLDCPVRDCRRQLVSFADGTFSTTCRVHTPLPVPGEAAILWEFFDAPADHDDRQRDAYWAIWNHLVDLLAELASVRCKDTGEIGCVRCVRDSVAVFESRIRAAEVLTGHIINEDV